MRMGFFLMLMPVLITSASAQTNTIAQQQAAIQQQITDGISNGTLSSQQIETLEAKQQQISNLQAASQSSGLTADQRTALGQAIQDETNALNRHAIPNNANNTNYARTGQGNLFHQTGPSTTPNPTGPDPFTYNTLGPDAYHAQKYANPAYNVPPYPTTNPAQTNEPAQYSAPAAATSQPVPPYPEYPANPGTGNVYGYGNSGTVVAPSTQGGNGVYVYQPGMSRGR